MGQLHDPSVHSGLSALPPPSDRILITNILYLLLGVYGWEYLHSLHVEWAFIRGRLAFRLSLIPYSLGRICSLIYLILHAVGRSPYGRDFSCISSALITALTVSIAVGCCSMNLMIRTWVIWRHSCLVHVLLFLLALGQWTMLAIDAVNIRTISTGHFCDLYPKYPQIDVVSMIYTMFVDLLVLILSVVGLSNQRSEYPLKRCLRVQGIFYFAAAVIAYIPTLVAALLHNDSIFDIVSGLTVIVITIASSRAVRSLHYLDTCDPGKTLGSADIALTTQIAIQQQTIAHSEGLPNGRQRVDEADRC